MSASTLCRYSARFHRGVLAQPVCAPLAAANTSSTSSLVQAAHRIVSQAGMQSWDPVSLKPYPGR